MDEPMGNHIFGFMKARLNNGKLYATYYYTFDQLTWKAWNAPIFDLIKR